ncbi:MAG: hypothetical protein DRJ65_17655 [Acidobacteria bacterium]|nr:MAG: hypothetical protein DRJ65_17655 [Acidobacteriota bacterium]
MKRALVFLIGVACTLAVPAQGSAQSEGTVVPNDTCETAFELAPPFSDPSDAANATPDMDVSCNQSATQTNFGVWYHYSPIEDGILDISDSSPADVVFALFEGADCASLSEVECFDLENGTNWSVTGGTEYWILIGTWGSTAPTGPFNINFSGPVPVELLAFSVE